jgi:hypothetical protein
MTILNYRQLTAVLGSALSGAGGPYRGRDVLTIVQTPGFPRQQYGGPYYGWPSDAVVAWAGVAMPTATALVPASAKLGDPSFTLHVQGTGFQPGSVILWNGNPEPTTYVSATELTTLVNMATAQVAMPIPVAVEVVPGLVTNSLIFDLQLAGTATATGVPLPAPPAGPAIDAPPTPKRPPRR